MGDVQLAGGLLRSGLVAADGFVQGQDLIGGGLRRIKKNCLFSADLAPSARLALQPFLANLETHAADFHHATAEALDDVGRGSIRSRESFVHVEAI